MNNNSTNTLKKTKNHLSPQLSFLDIAAFIFEIDIYSCKQNEELRNRKGDTM